MNRVKIQLEKNKKSRNKQNEWFTPTNERNSYQSYRDTFLNYLYHKKRTSSNPHRKKMYKALFDLLRKNPEKKSEIYIDILNEINKIRINSKNSSDIYKEFLTNLEKLYNKYKNNSNNFSNALVHNYLKRKGNQLLNNNLNTNLNNLTKKLGHRKLFESKQNENNLNAFLNELSQNEN
jgi:hypothetical protein